TASLDAARRQAVDVEVVEPDVPGGEGVDAAARPGVGAVALRAGLRVVVDAVGAVGDLEVTHLDVVAPVEAQHAADALRPDQLRRRAARLADDPRAAIRGGAARDPLHRAAVADHVGAGADDELVAAGDPRRARG